MKKRVLAALLTGAMLVSMLAGCGDDTAGGESGTASAGAGTTEQTAGSAEGDGEMYHIVMAYMGNEQADHDKVDAAISELTQRELGMTFESVQMGYGEFRDKLKLMLTGGDKLDVTPIYFADASNYINAGQLTDLGPLIDAKGQGIVDQMGEGVAKGGAVNGFVYGIPSRKESASMAGVIMRKDICEKYQINVDEIHTYDDLEKVYEIVKAGEPGMDMVVGSNLSEQILCWDPLLDNFGVLMEDVETHTWSTKVENFFETDLFRERCERFRRWYDKGYIMKDAATTKESSKNLFNAGNTFSFFEPIKPGYVEESAQSMKYELVTAYIGDTDVTPNVIASNNVNFYNWGIPSSCEDPEKAMEFLNWAYTSPEFNNLLNFGIEGEHYTFVDGSDKVIDFPEGIDASNASYCLNIGWECPNQFIGYIWNGRPEDIWDQYIAFNDSADWSIAYGFMYDASSVSNELTALQNVYNQYYKALCTGSMDPETGIDQFNEALYAAGLQKVMDVKQEQLDQWLAETGGYTHEK